jgi:hypothetical protein
MSASAAVYKSPLDALDAIEDHEFNFLRFHDNAEPIEHDVLNQRHRVLLTVKNEFVQTLSKLRVLETLASEVGYEQNASYDVIHDLKESVKSAKSDTLELRQAVSKLERQLHDQITDLMKAVHRFQLLRQEFDNAWLDPVAEQNRVNVPALLARDATEGVFGGSATPAQLELSTVADCEALAAAQVSALTALERECDGFKAASAALAADAAALAARRDALLAREAALDREAAVLPVKAALEVELAGLLGQTSTFAAVSGVDIDLSELAAAQRVVVTFRRVALDADRRSTHAKLNLYLSPVAAAASPAATSGAEGTAQYRLVRALLVIPGSLNAGVDIAHIVEHAVETQDVAFLIREVQAALFAMA